MLFVRNAPFTFIQIHKCTDLKWPILYTKISTCVSNTCTQYLVAYNTFTIIFKCILRVLKMYCRSVNVCQKRVASCREKKIIKKWDAWLFDVSDGYVQLCLCWIIFCGFHYCTEAFCLFRQHWSNTSVCDDPAQWFPKLIG